MDGGDAVVANPMDEGRADGGALMLDVEEPVNNIEEAVRRVLKTALAGDGVIRGMNQVIKAVESNIVYVVFLAQDCGEEGCRKLITALCAEKKVPVVPVPESKKLGEWAGLCKFDREGNPRKVVGAAAVAITSYNQATAALDFLQKHIRELSQQ